MKIDRKKADPKKSQNVSMRDSKMEKKPQNCRHDFLPGAPIRREGWKEGGINEWRERGVDR